MCEVVERAWSPAGVVRAGIYSIIFVPILRLHYVYNIHARKQAQVISNVHPPSSVSPIAFMVVELNTSKSALDELAAGMKSQLRFPKLSCPCLLPLLFFAGGSLGDGRFFTRNERPGDFSTALSEKFGFDFILARKWSCGWPGVACATLG